jgi:hypothetical protein
MAMALGRGIVDAPKLRLKLVALLRTLTSSVSLKCRTPPRLSSYKRLRLSAVTGGNALMPASLQPRSTVSWRLAVKRCD